MSLQSCMICSMKTDASAMRPACFWTLQLSHHCPKQPSLQWFAATCRVGVPQKIGQLSGYFNRSKDKLHFSSQYNTPPRTINCWIQPISQLVAPQVWFLKVVAPQKFKLKTCYSTSFKILKLKILWRHNILNWKVVAPQNPNLKSCGATKS